MSHHRKTPTAKTPKVGAPARATLRTALIGTAALLPLLGSAAQAATPSRLPLAAQKSYSTTLQNAAQEREMRILDWRTPHVDLRFNLSKADTIEKLSVTLSADPLPGVDPSTPLMVQFNNGKPTQLKTRGQGFDATIRLDERRVRATGNVLRVSYAADCDPNRGGFALNLDNSRIDLRARAKSRRLQLGELEQRLGGSAFAPDTVGLIASGPDATALQALGAQAMGLRSDTIPDFRTSTRGTDFNLIMVPRSELYKYTNDGDLLARTGAGIEIGRNNANDLFLTGDTPEQVRRSVEAFSSAFLPRSMRSFTSPGEISVQSPLDYTRVSVAGTERLNRLNVTAGALREYVFDVTDPDAMAGDLVLRLTRDSQTEPGARLSAVLNGENLGEATLDARRKTVSYPIRAGQLVGSQNRLELTTKASDAAPQSCGAAKPFIAIGAGSKLRLSADRPSDVTDLSRFAANGSVFGAGYGESTQVVLPQGNTDFAASLGVVARLGKATGRGWIEADFVRGERTDTDRHQLVIEPFNQIDASLRNAAPRALQSAWRGAPTQGDNRLASIERFASLDADEAVRLAARSLRASGSVRSGGVAAIFPGDQGQLVGLISNTPNSRFTTSMDQISSDAHWNGLSGGVARWNDRSVVMAQTAIGAPSVIIPDVATQTGGWSDRFAAMELDGLVPDFEWPEFSMPEVDMGAVRLAAADKVDALRNRFAPVETPSGILTLPKPDYRTERLDGLQSTATTRMAELSAPKLSLPELKLPRVPVPSLAPRKRKAVDATPRLRGKIDLQSSAARGDLKSKTRKWVRGTQRWLRDTTRPVGKAFNRVKRESRVNAPDMGPITFAGTRVPVPALLLALVFALAVIGLMFSNPNSRSIGRH